VRKTFRKSECTTECRSRNTVSCDGRIRELTETGTKKTDEIEKCLAGANKIQIIHAEVQVENNNTGEATSTNEPQVFMKKQFDFDHMIHLVLVLGIRLQLLFVSPL